MFCVYTKPAKESEKCGVYHATGQPKKRRKYYFSLASKNSEDNNILFVTQFVRYWT